MSAIVRFENLPGDSRKKHDWAAIGGALKKRPQRWAIALVCNSSAKAASLAQVIREGRYPVLAAIGTFEAVSRTVDGEPRVYARWVGEPS